MIGLRLTFFIFLVIFVLITVGLFHELFVELVHKASEELLGVMLLKPAKHGVVKPDGLQHGARGGVGVRAGGVAPNFVDQLSAK